MSDVTNSVVPPWVFDAIWAAKRRRHDRNASELGAPAGQRSRKPAPGLSPPVTQKTDVPRGELPAPHVWA